MVNFKLNTFWVDFIKVALGAVGANILLFNMIHLSKIAERDYAEILLVFCSILLTSVTCFFVTKNKKNVCLSLSILIVVLFMIVSFYYMSVKTGIIYREVGFIGPFDELVFVIPIFFIPHIIVSWILYWIYSLYKR